MVASACGSEADTATAELPSIESSTTSISPSSDTASEARDTSSGGNAGNAGNEDTGQNSAEDAEQASDGEPVDPEVAIADYEKCMADQGIEMQMVTGNVDGSGFESLDDTIITDPDELDGTNQASTFGSEDFEEAEKTCGPILEDAFGDFELSPEQEAEQADEMFELQKCLAAEGFDIDMGGGSFELGGEDFDFEAFEGAMTTCGTGLQTAGDPQ